MNPGGVVRGVLTALFAGGAMGWGASFISQWFYLILLFPVFIGAVLGLVVGRTLKAGKVRNLAVAGVIGFVGGVVAMGAMHYFDFQRFESDVQAEFAEATAEDVEAVAARWEEIVAADAQYAALTGESALPSDLPSYLRFMATEGVQITGRAGSSTGFNLGFVGSYIYWILEVLVVAGFTVFIARKLISVPFCVRANDWKAEQALGPFHASGRRVADALQRGDIGAVTAGLADASKGRDSLRMTLFTSPRFADTEPLEAKLEDVTRNAKGLPTRKTLAFVTLTPDALEPLRAAAAQALANERSPVDAEPPV